MRCSFQAELRDSHAHVLPRPSRLVAMDRASQSRLAGCRRSSTCVFAVSGICSSHPILQSRSERKGCHDGAGEATEAAEASIMCKVFLSRFWNRAKGKLTREMSPFCKSRRLSRGSGRRWTLRIPARGTQTSRFKPRGWGTLNHLTVGQPGLGLALRLRRCRLTRELDCNAHGWHEAESANCNPNPI
jgi:hypothetical protein